MAYLNANVSRATPGGSIEFITDKGETFLLDAGDANSMNCGALPAGARVRLTMQGGRITAVKPINQGLALATHTAHKDDSRGEARVEGVGGMNPCEGDLNELLAGAGSEAIKQLVRHLCSEKRLVWYWRTPATPMVSSPASERLSPELIDMLSSEKARFERLYNHQVIALDALRQGQHVMVLTPTASGKTNCYNPAIFEALMGDPAATALYIFPLNALMDDQCNKMDLLAKRAQAFNHNIPIQMLHGGMKTELQSVINGTTHPQIIATNPELLSHLLMNASQSGMKQFLHNLRFVVLDEAHFYRSLFGLHMAGIVRRLRLACNMLGNDQPGPQFILSSATVGAPLELAKGLTGINGFRTIKEKESGHSQPQRHWLMLDPLAGDDKQDHTAHLHQAAEALVDVLTTGKSESLKAIVFVRSFRDLNATFDLTQRLLGDRGRHDLADRIAKYNSGMIALSERKRIYGEFKETNRLRALISTNALEAGIDLGDLDVCILAGFPSHVMQMRQMAGRAGRQQEGAVIFIPRLAGVMDRYFEDDPARLINNPSESFVIDADNPYIARRHLVAAATSMSGGITREQAAVFGRYADHIIADAEKERVLQETSLGWTAKQRFSGPWAVERIRGREQEPWALCDAPVYERHCAENACLNAAMKAQPQEEDSEKCKHIVQLLDKQYVYREAHPGAVFESTSGNFYHCDSLDEQHRLVQVSPMPEKTLWRTFPLEEIDVHSWDELDRRQLANGAQLAWGRASVTRSYTVYGEYQLIPRRRCRKCGLTFAGDVKHCDQCGLRTRPFMDRSEPKYFDFERPYHIVLETIACRLELPAEMEPVLKGIAHCQINEAGNKVREFVASGKPFRSPQEVAQLAGVDEASAAIAFDYLQHWRPQAGAWQEERDHVTMFPGVYGQCLCHALRDKLPESPALDAYAKLTGYPATTDTHHICRCCYGGVLMPAAHTLEHIVASKYPMVALGDQQDIDSVTYAIYPQTGMTTVVWYDQYDGGIGAAEKVFNEFERLIEGAGELLMCDCNSDAGCAQCVQKQACDRHNDALSKVGAVSLSNLLLGKPAFIPSRPFQRSMRNKREQARQAHAPRNERAPHDVPRPGEQTQTAGVDPFALMRVQDYVHDIVLERVIKVRSNEIAGDLPPVSIVALQQAYQQIKSRQRPTTWQFDPAWDAWHVLHILDSASEKMARAARNAIAMSIHPDVFTGNKADGERMMKMVNAAWEKINSAKS